MFERYIEESADRKQAWTDGGYLALGEVSSRQGALVVLQELDSRRAIQSVDIRSLDEELKGWQKDRKKLDKDSDEANALDRQIEAHSRRIELYHQRQAQLSQLHAQVSEIVSALQSTYLELVDLGSQDPTTMLNGDGGAAQRLGTAVEAP